MRRDRALAPASTQVRRARVERPPGQSQLNPPTAPRKPLPRWVALAGVVVLSFIALSAAAVGVYAAWLFHDMPDASDLIDYHPPTATRAYAWDGTLIGEFSRERRIFVPYDAIPAQTAQAFLAAEDHGFFKHGGVDVGGFGRAMVKNVINLAQGRRLEGGSTITQQVAKNILLNSDQTIGRKLKEAILASQLEQTLSKERILELYMNEIWLGYRSYGVGAAAYNYFGKSLSELTLAESAYLAALPKGPDNYHPIRRKAQAMARRNWVIGQMAELGWVTRAEATAAQKEDLVVQSTPSRSQYRDADYFVEEVRRISLNMKELGDERLNAGGYYMRTTLDPKLQSEAKLALMNGLETYDRRHGWRGPWGHVTTTDGWEDIARKTVKPRERQDWKRAIVTSVAGGAVSIRTIDGAMGNLAGQDVSWARAGKGIGSGDLVFVEPAKDGGFRLKQVPAVNGALVAMEPYSGRVVAMVGGYSFSLSSFNRATQALRQPGSSFKPIVYAAALESGYTPASTVLDAPITLRGYGGQDWSPENYSRDYYGALTLRKGLELSRNTMTVRLAQGVGMNKIASLAERLGVTKKMDKVLAMALGSGETTTFKMAAAYSSFVNGGKLVEPHLIEMVEDRNGKVIWRADRRQCDRCGSGFSGDESPRIPRTGDQVMDPITAYQITSMLEGVVQRGTATAALSIGKPLGGKTGTTNDYRSAWFMGFSPHLVVGVYIGFDDNRSLGNAETGAQAALPIFIDFMGQALQDKPAEPFKAPANAKYAMIRGIREAFRPGTEPSASTETLGAAGAPAGPQPYNQVFGNGQVTGAPNAAAAVAPAAAPPPKKKDDLSDLF
ncbi:MAG: penicillin-binding protein 1A [Alphaproteobacteria bacterium]|nr:penicillin-binding protein 1A [Alphaproteobacteria bacterium]MBU1513518.1 penicillin-binding protein 1A [Alphaproteobacteria bacterium]MBU2094837.1 penicillin-binding protein 1A [Alphaproteobacteria bacterium]MBU2151094.1 penicillin-binding protein 1A [Alphaproteobacteria bacterium]MBU2309377.1 penicillin-binding protein 1A [Alphaproteobacteria bacterium]